MLVSSWHPAERRVSVGVGSPAAIPLPELHQAALLRRARRCLQDDKRPLLDINAPHTYVVLVSGDSMTGAGIFDGDHLIVSRALEAKPGDVVVACLNGDVFVKRLGKSHGTYVLQSEHPDYAPRCVLNDDELMIWGVVSHSLRNHRVHA